MEELKQAMDMLNKNKLHENLYMRIYSFATENVNGYIDYFDFNNKSLLTLGSSGDQILNAFNNGCQDITLLDINPFAPFYINLKIAGIMSLIYEEFQYYFFRWIGMHYNYQRYYLELFNKLSNNLKSIDYNSYYFFDKIFHTYTREKISNYLMNDDENNYKVIKGINNYLINEEAYNNLKKKIKDISFKFILKNIFEFNSDLKYDNIFLSNLCSLRGMGILNLRDLLNKIKNNLKDNGSMMFAYLWNTNFDDDEENFDLKEIYRMPATRTFLKEFITEHHNITGIYDLLHDKNTKSDLVLIYRK